MQETSEKTIDYVTTYYVAHQWSAPDSELKRWQLIIDSGRGELQWVYTYNPALTKVGTQKVEFYRDTSMRLCIRKPKEKS